MDLKTQNILSWVVGILGIVIAAATGSPLGGVLFIPAVIWQIIIHKKMKKGMK